MNPNLSKNISVLVRMHLVREKHKKSGALTPTRFTLSECGLVSFAVWQLRFAYSRLCKSRLSDVFAKFCFQIFYQFLPLGRAPLNSRLREKTVSIGSNRLAKKIISNQTYPKQPKTVFRLNTNSDDVGQQSRLCSRNSTKKTGDRKLSRLSLFSWVRY